MGYTKQGFVNNDETKPLRAEQLIAMEDAIIANETEVAKKQPKGNYLTAHQPLKTINGQSIAGTGNISIGSSAVNYDLNVKAVNHRGYSKGAPENTIPAYILSKEKGFTYVECDVSFTSDGVAVLLHDATIDRTSDGSGNISNLTYAEVSQYDFGYWYASKYKGTKIPTFSEFIAYCKGLGLHPYIELKSNGGYTKEQIGQIVSEVEAHGMRGKVTYISFNATFLGYVKEHDTKARLGFLADVNSSTIATAVALRTGENEVFMDVNYTYVNQSKVSLCMENDLPLEVWTVNDQSVIKGLNPYISGVTSDNQIAGQILYNKYSTYTYSEDLGGDTGGDDGGDDGTGGEDTGDTTCTITTNLTNATISNSDTSVEKGAPYNATVSVQEGYVVSSVTVTMGNVDITSSAYADGVISIDSVSGNIVITIVASDGSYEVVRTITQDELSVGTQLSGNHPYTNSSGTRTSYVNFDLTYEVGYTYKFDFVTGNNLEYSIGIQCYNQLAMAQIEAKTGILSNTYDPGWQVNGVELTLDQYKNSPIVAYRFTFKRNNGSTMQNGDIVSVTISRKSFVTNYSVTNDLTGVSSDNYSTQVSEGDPYTATLTASTYYQLDTVAVTMGGVDITADVYSDGVVTIPSVTGDIVITATANDTRTMIHNWDFTNSMVDSIGGVEAVTTATQGSDGITFGKENVYINLTPDGAKAYRNMTFEIDIPSASLANKQTHMRLFGISNNTTQYPYHDTATDASVLIYRYNNDIGWTWYVTAWGDKKLDATIYPKAFFGGKTVRVEFDENGYMTVSYAPLGSTNFIGVETFNTPCGYDAGWWVIGSSVNNHMYSVTFSAVRVYSAAN